MNIFPGTAGDSSDKGIETEGTQPTPAEVLRESFSEAPGCAGSFRTKNCRTERAGAAVMFSPVIEDYNFLFQNRHGIDILSVFFQD